MNPETILRKKKPKKSGNGGVPPDLAQAMKTEGYLHQLDAAKLIDRDKRWFTTRKIRTKGTWYLFVSMEDVAKALGPELCKLRGLSAENGWGTKG